MVQTENKTPYFDHKSPTRHSQNTNDKFPNMLNNRILRDITQLLDPH